MSMCLKKLPRPAAVLNREESPMRTQLSFFLLIATTSSSKCGSMLPCPGHTISHWSQLLKLLRFLRIQDSLGFYCFYPWASKFMKPQILRAFWLQDHIYSVLRCLGYCIQSNFSWAGYFAGGYGSCSATNRVMGICCKPPPR